MHEHVLEGRQQKKREAETTIHHYLSPPARADVNVSAYNCGRRPQLYYY